MIILAAVVLASVLIALVALLRAGIAREDSEYSLRSEPPTFAAALTRRIVGLYASMPEDPAQADPANGQPDASCGHFQPPNGSGR